MHLRIIPLLALVVLVACPAMAADLPTWKLTELKTVTGFSAAAADDGHNFLAASGGRSAVMTVPIWWGKEVRAPENTVYVLKISYKDTIAKPAVFSAHAGRGSYWGLSEVHRFGGAADDKWKIAEVPLSWDLVMRKNVPGDVTELAINVAKDEKDLPVESIEVTLAGKGAAAKYFQETRAWVAKAQDAKRAQAAGGAGVGMEGQGPGAVSADVPDGGVSEFGPAEGRGRRGREAADGAERI